MLACFHGDVDDLCVRWDNVWYEQLTSSSNRFYRSPYREARIAQITKRLDNTQFNLTSVWNHVNTRGQAVARIADRGPYGITAIVAK